MIEDKRKYKDKGGRPTKFSPLMLKASIEYIKGEYTKQEAIPTMAGLSIYLDVNEDTLYEWLKKGQEFSEAIKRLKSSQKMKLITGGLIKKYDASMAKFELLNNHGYKEKSEVEHSGKINVPELEKLTNEIRKIRQ